MAEEATTNTFVEVDGQRYPSLPLDDLTGREVDWIETRAGDELMAALSSGRAAASIAWAAVQIARARPGADRNKVFEELMDKPRGSVLFVEEPVEAESEAGPTKPAPTRAKSKPSGAQA